MDIILNVITGNIFTQIIVIVAIIVLAIEICAVANYIWLSECKFSSKAIKFLEDNQTKLTFTFQDCETIQKGLFTWINNYLDGKKKYNKIEVKKDNNYYILFSYPSVLNKPVPRSPAYFAPTLLTALGILGTFLGIFFGLQEIGINNIESTESLLKSSTQLLSGMKTAFSTSLAGLGSASGMIFLLAIGANFRQTARNNLRKRLSNIAFVQSPQQILSRLDTSSLGEAAKTLQSATSNLSHLSNLTPENIASAIQQTMAIEKTVIVEELQAQTSYLQNLTPEAIAQTITPLLHPINQELAKLRETQEQQQSTVHSLVKELRQELIEPVVQRLDHSAKLTEEASLAVKELKNELGGIAQSLAGAVETIQEFQQDTLIKLQDFAQNLQTILSQFGHDTQGVLEQVAVEINQAVAQSIQGMEAQREAFEASAKQASQTFTGIREDLQEALTTQAQHQQKMLEKVQVSTEGILQEANQAFQNQSKTITKVGEEASQLLNQAKDNLLATLTNIDDMLQKTRETVQIELQKFRLEYQTALEEFFAEQNNLLNETLGQQREGLAKVVNDLQITFNDEAKRRKELSKQVNHSLTHISETVTIVSNLVNATGMNSSERFAQLEELAHTIGNEATQVENAYEKMTYRFERVLTQITDEFNQLSIQTNQKINEYLTQAGDSYSKSFEQADSAMANVCTQLNQTSHGLMNVAEYLVASTNDLKQNNGIH